jgi:GNAT superfamily N-acetyltransferase
VNAQVLIDEYAAECSIFCHDPQVEMYAAMERSGALQCFGAFLANELIGFVSVLSAVMPHHGKRVATIESLFVLPAHRDSGAGDDLLSAAEQYATESECVALLYTARIGSTLEKILSRRAGCEASHTVFTRWL